jgi:hypothetical protein
MVQWMKTALYAWVKNSYIEIISEQFLPENLFKLIELSTFISDTLECFAPHSTEKLIHMNNTVKLR